MSRSSTLSRRGLLAGIPAVTAVTTSPLVAAEARLAETLSSGQDAELIELGSQMDAIFRRYYELRTIADPVQEEFGEQFEPHREAAQRGEITGERMIEIRDQLMAALKCGDESLDDINGRLMDFTDAYDRLADRIMELPAQTSAGLAVKARCAAFVCEHMWSDDAPWDLFLARKALEAVITLAGDRLPWDLVEALS